MKTTQVKKLKTKILKISTKQSRALLPQYKAKHNLIRGKRKSFLKGLIMNSSRGRTEIVQDVSIKKDPTNRKQPVLKCNIKQRKKNSCTLSKEFNDTTQNSVGHFLESSHDSVEASLVRERDDKRYTNISEQRNIGAPVIVEALSETLSSLSIPVFKTNQNIQTQENNVAADRAGKQ